MKATLLRRIQDLKERAPEISPTHWPRSRHLKTSQQNPHQFNPGSAGAKSLGQWLTAVMAMKGTSSQMTVPDAVAMIHATPPTRRSEFAREMWARRRERAQTGSERCHSSYETRICRHHRPGRRKREFTAEEFREVMNSCHFVGALGKDH